ncbi:MAG: HD domain-containing phosphohydrolase [Ketobacter sp.]
MTSFDPLADKAYAVRLADLGETREVIASEDIYNDQGTLLIKKGMPVNKKMSERIIRFKLLRPIESSIDVTGSVGARELFRDIHSVLEQWAPLQTMHANLGLETTLKQLSMLLAKYPVLRQKLTVMQEQMQALYRQTLAVTWLSMAIGSQMKLDKAQLEECFLAALTHDFGMMHIDPAVLEKKEKLSAPEWRQIQAHTVIGKTLVENIPGMNPRVARIVVEHHERCDGTGYPAGKFSDRLTKESQIIALSDSVVSVYLNRYEKSGRTIRDLMPFIQVNSESHFYECYAALVAVLKQGMLTEISFITNDNVTKQLEHLVSKNDTLNYLLSALENVVTEIGQENEHRFLQSARTILTQVMKTVRGSGILDEGYIRWIKQVSIDKIESAYREAADVLIMLEEMEWHLTRTIKILDNFLDQSTAIENSDKETMRARLIHSKSDAKQEHQSETVVDEKFVIN